LKGKRVLALDVGNRRIGVAYSDPLGISANPLPYIENNEKVFENIKKLVEEYDIGKLVVGLPLTLKGEEGEQARITKAFVEELKKHIPDIPVEFVDERFTTSLAEQHLRETTKKSKRKKKVDSLAAVFILKTYLQQQQFRNG